MSRTERGAPRGRLAVAPILSRGVEVLPSRPASFRPVVVGRGPSHGAIGSYTGDRDRAVDLWLDFYDAANELADGSLPGQEAA